MHGSEFWAEWTAEDEATPYKRQSAILTRGEALEAISDPRASWSIANAPEQLAGLSADRVASFSEFFEPDPAELEALRAEKAQPAAREVRPTPSAARPAQRVESEDDRRIREARERGAKLMEPDDDLRMPMGQKIVLAVLALLVGIIVVMHFLVG